jgi:hypothetical protein
MTKRYIFILVAILLTVQLGCAGSMKGVVRRDAKRVNITYTDSRLGKGTLQTVLAGGERFEGKTVRIGWMGAQSDSAVSGDESTDFEEVQMFEGNAEATLSGNKGNFMKCRFNLTDSIIGLSSGGFGMCQVTDGRIIDIFF